MNPGLSYSHLNVFILKGLHIWFEKIEEIESQINHEEKQIFAETQGAVKYRHVFVLTKWVATATAAVTDAHLIY